MCGDIFGGKKKDKDKDKEKISSKKSKKSKHSLSKKSKKKVIDKTKNVWEQISSPSDLTSSTPITKEYKTGEDGIKSYKAVIAKHGYTWGKEIGSGAFGKVYKVTKMSDNSIVACKVIDLQSDNSIASRNKRRMRELKNELFVFEKVKHKHLIELYEHFIIDNKVYIFMEYADADSLSKYVKTNDLVLFQEEFVKELFIDIFLGVRHLHQKRIAHRDLKNGNVLLKKDGSRASKLIAKVADFGLSAYCRPKDGNVKAQTSRRGTPTYMAPEILEPYPRYNPFPPDIWALGVILYTLMNKVHPFEIRCDNKMTDAECAKLLKHQKETKLEFKNKKKRRISQEWKDLIEKMLTFDPKKRPTDEDVRQHPWVHDSISQREESENNP